jgi:hypothetical protein
MGPVVVYRCISRRSALAGLAAEKSNERVELADRSVRIVSANYSPASTSGETNGVQSSGWLRHSAAASLYRMGLLLQATARQLEQP